MSRKQGTRRAQGWWWRFPAVCALVGGFFMALMPIGWALAQASDAIGRLG